MKFEFTKMQGLGNDYIIVNGNRFGGLLDEISELAPALSDRHFGIGSDGVIFVLPSDSANAMMRIFNSDGSEAEMCGNGIRQVAKFLYDNRIVHLKEMTIETLAGIKQISITPNDRDLLKTATVNLGAPILSPSLIPANAEINRKGFAEITLTVEKRKFNWTLVSLGNPHAVTFVDDLNSLSLEKFGRSIEFNTQIFPKRTNVEFVKVITPKEIQVRVWERGSGETMACGTGASASLVASVLQGLTERKVTVHLKGGDLYIEWVEGEGVLMTGGAEKVFEGIADSDWFKK